nr:tripartite tricarboxylate transporter substrate binding protein [Candidimonas humi]
MSIVRLLAGPLFLCSLAFSNAATAADPTFPARPITLVVPFSPGGGADAIARAIGHAMGKDLKVSIVVENKGGASGMIGARSVAAAAPDGYTLLLSTDGMLSNPNNADARSQKALSHLMPVANLAEAPLVIAARVSLPVHNLTDLVAYAKSHPDAQLSYGIPGLGTTHHIAGVMLSELAGIKMLSVPYKGTSAGAQGLASGSIDLLIGNSTTIEPLVGAGKARILAVTSRTPFKLLPSAPTVARIYPGYSITTSYGLMVPAGTPQGIVEILARAAKLAVNDPATQNLIEHNGLTASYMGPKDYRQMLDTTTATRKRIIEKLGIKPR